MVALFCSSKKEEEMSKYARVVDGLVVEVVNLGEFSPGDVFTPELANEFVPCDGSEVAQGWGYSDGEFFSSHRDRYFTVRCEGGKNRFAYIVLRSRYRWWLQVICARESSFVSKRHDRPDQHDGQRYGEPTPQSSC